MNHVEKLYDLPVIEEIKYFVKKYSNHSEYCYTLTYDHEDFVMLFNKIFELCSISKHNIEDGVTLNDMANILIELGIIDAPKLKDGYNSIHPSNSRGEGQFIREDQRELIEDLLLVMKNSIHFYTDILNRIGILDRYKTVDKLSEHAITVSIYNRPYLDVM